MAKPDVGDSAPVRALDRSLNQVPDTVAYNGLHGLADYLGYEHTCLNTVAALRSDLLEFAVPWNGSTVREQNALGQPPWTPRTASISAMVWMVSFGATIIFWR